MKRGLALIASALPLCAMAADWQIVGATDNQLTYIDKSSISVAKPYKKAWVMYDFNDSVNIKGTYPVQQYKSSLVLQYVDCQGRTLNSKQEVFYSKNAKEGEVVLSKSYPINESGFSEVIPDSIGEAILNFICRNSQSK